MSDQQLAEELQKPIIGKFKKRKDLCGQYLGADLANMHLMSKFNKVFRSLIMCN